MTQKDSRRARKQQENMTTEKKRGNGINKNYYIVIGILITILTILIIYLFNSGDNNDLLQRDQESSLVDNSKVNETEEDVNESNIPNETENTDASSSEDITENNEGEESNDDTPEIGETRAIANDAPYDSNYVVDYSEGSSDRVAIKNEVTAATGLENNLIEWWIGQDGPGRVVATVSNPSQTEVYEVYLQYGEGNWHVVSYQRLAEVPDF